MPSEPCHAEAQALTVLAQALTVVATQNGKIVLARTILNSTVVAACP
jgi:hypothetical protein